MAGESGAEHDRTAGLVEFIAADPSECGVDRVFQFGFKSEVLSIRHEFCGENLQSVQHSLDAVAPFIGANMLPVLQRMLGELRELEALLQSYDADQVEALCIAWRIMADEAREQLHLEDITLYRWCDSAERFARRTYDAFMESSPFRRWLDVGKAIAWCEIAATHRASCKFLPGRFSVLQECTRKLPQPFLEEYPHLKSFCEIAVDTDGLRQWWDGVHEGEEPFEPDQDNDGFPDYLPLVACFYWHIRLAILAFSGMRVERAGGGEPPPSDTQTKWRQWYLGLELHEGRRRVRRNQGEVEVNLLHRDLSWAILRKLVEHRDRPISTDWLKDVWEENGYDNTPEDGTVVAEISNLRDALRPLDVGIKNIRRVGYHLVDGAAQKPKRKTKESPDRG